ncbi:NADPH-dependent FMN reductase [Pseudooctadecabacter jejudonensis]|uniref:FMN-dependent NADPH-azoreductase n=1 Tax=Pseudooctadecabacter jejudonensis TaxID=1391910 RepID=A0A1Y5S463_9RHOB|nr:NAD(P)H-dependent oxidoreductase [Pseudooctadecabacter jejudonensis]SLN29649.1 FMN-dependent NADPH-azoreductase [Pseudooctadecabacter jejudonensis]
MAYLLGLSGALRGASTNTKLIHAAGRVYGGDLRMGDLRLPLYDGDLEEAEGVPASVQTLADQIKGAEAVVISTPEYNKSISGVLKNALDWVSRTDGSPWAGKPVAIMSATAGRAGGERTQFALRLCMMPFRTRLIQGPEMLLADSSNQFDADGNLTDARAQKALEGLMDALKAEVARG